MLVNFRNGYDNKRTLGSRLDLTRRETSKGRQIFELRFPRSQTAGHGAIVPSGGRGRSPNAGLGNGPCKSSLFPKANEYYPLERLISPFFRAMPGRARLPTPPRPLLFSIHNFIADSRICAAAASRFGRFTGKLTCRDTANAVVGEFGCGG